MSKKDLKKYNDMLLCYAILILTIGLVGGSFLIAVGVKCDTINAISFNMMDSIIILTFFVTSVMMYLAAKKEEFKKLFE